jgi:hypothetical protein
VAALKNQAAWQMIWKTPLSKAGDEKKIIELLNC